MTLQFDSKIWKQGNSLIVTIPKDVRDMYNLKEGDMLRIDARLVTKEELKTEEELRQMQLKYSNFGSGVLLYKNEEIAQLAQVFFNTTESRVKDGVDLITGDFKNSAVLISVQGIIVKGEISPSTYDKCLSTNMKRDIIEGMLYSGTMELKTSDGKDVTIEIRHTFDNPIFGEKTPLIEKITFSGYLIKR